MDALRAYFSSMLRRIFRNENGNPAVKVYWTQNERALRLSFKNTQERGSERKELLTEANLNDHVDALQAYICSLLGRIFRNEKGNSAVKYIGQKTSELCALF